MKRHSQWTERIDALSRVARYKPAVTTGIVGLSIVAAFLEGIGLSFILPIIELAQGDVDPTQASGLLGLFVSGYEAVGLPFTLGYLVVGVALVMTVRYGTGFLVSWLEVDFQTRYAKHLQRQVYDRTLEDEGSDEILNAIVTQADYAGKVVKYAMRIVKYGFIVLAYLAIALYISPILTAVSAGLLGSLVLLFKRVLSTGDELGNRVADANRGIQQNAQAGTQGINEVKTFGLIPEFKSRFHEATVEYTQSYVRLSRNEAAINQFYTLATAITIFVLIYVALTLLSVPLGMLGVFLFAMFQLGPRVSNLIRQAYKLEGQLPHLVRTHQFIDALEAHQESTAGGRSVPEPVGRVTFEDVSFSYGNSAEVLDDLSFDIGETEFVAFVGPSGAGKSTIASLLIRLYTPDSGQIQADGVSLEEFDLNEWRSKVSIVRQNPYIFDDTLRRNITVGARDATQAEIDRVCEIAGVDEFLDSLPQGYETQLGDQGVRLSGGQRQRVAVARALLKDTDLLILDEATSDLDSGLERRIHGAIERMDRDYAIVAIAHRLSTVRNADRIYTLEDGHITEVGGHEDLIDSGGTYAELHQIQTEAS